MRPAAPASPGSPGSCGCAPRWRRARPWASIPEVDELAFYPLLYWPITDGPGPMSPAARRNVESFMANGGTVLFDLRDPSGGAQFLGQASRRHESLRRLLEGVDIPPLVPVPPDHVLTKAFYLMQDFPRAAMPAAPLGGGRARRRQGRRHLDPDRQQRLGRRLGRRCLGPTAQRGGSRRRPPAGDGLSLRRQPGDVRADRQLQGRPGPRTLHPGALGQ